MMFQNILVHPYVVHNIFSATGKVIRFSRSYSEWISSPVLSLVLFIV